MINLAIFNSLTWSFALQNVIYNMKSTDQMKWLIDHSYIGFAPSYSTALVRMHQNIIWLPKCFTKSHLLLIYLRIPIFTAVQVLRWKIDLLT